MHKIILFKIFQSTFSILLSKLLLIKQSDQNKYMIYSKSKSISWCKHLLFSAHRIFLSTIFLADFSLSKIVQMGIVARGYFWIINFWLQISFKWVPNSKLYTMIYKMKLPYEQSNFTKQIKVKLMIINGNTGKILMIWIDF